MLETLTEQIREAAANQSPLHIVGGGSKHFYGRDLSHLPELKTGDLNELVSYEPSELVVQVQAGYPVKDLIDLLAKENQMLAFDPPDFGGSTIGGVVASGISGSRRPFLGACRDFLLGVNIIDGAGNQLRFGGQVMKNVAGYDVSRLMAGAMGCLGLITEVSLKVIPKHEAEASYSKSVEFDQVLRQMRRLSLHPETSGLAYWQGKLYVRFSGSAVSLRELAADFSGEPVGPGFWQELDSLQLFAAEQDLWRVSTQASQNDDELLSADLIDWGGAQRWYTSKKPSVTRGYVTRVKSSEPGEVFAPLNPYLMKVHQKLKTAFDPKGIFNPGKMYPEF